MTDTRGLEHSDKGWSLTRWSRAHTKKALLYVKPEMRLAFMFNRDTGMNKGKEGHMSA